MKIKLLKTIITLFLLVSLFSCRGKDELTHNQKPIVQLAKGKIVSELDRKTWHVFQDHNAHYWFGSKGNGLFHYDRKRLIQYTEEDGLISNSIRGIQEDKAGNLYFETMKGVSKYDGNTFTTLVPVESKEWKLEADDVWFNCAGSPNDVYRYDGKTMYELKLPRKNLYEAFETVVMGLTFKGMNSSPYSVFGLDKDKAGNLWIGTVVAGAFRYDGDSFLWVAEKELSRLLDGRVPGVRSMVEDQDGYMWLSNFKSKYKIITKDTITNYEKLMGIEPSDNVFQDGIPYFNSALSDESGDLWMTTYGSGVWKYNGKELVHFPITDENEEEVLLISIYEDNKNTLWLGTDNVGVFKFNGSSFQKFVF